MKIGEFAQKYNLTIDAIRHYMDLELILPDKKGGHYFFDKKEESDIRKILELKKLRFSLAEIQRILVYTRVSQLRSYEDKMYIKNLFDSKLEELKETNQEIKIAIDVLKNKINEMSHEDNIDKCAQIIKKIEMGMPISFLQYLACPICNKFLELKAGSIINNMVMQGNFKCSCGYTGKIKNGVYIALDEEDKTKLSNTNFDSKSNAFTLAEYVEGTDSSFVNHIYKSIDKIISYMEIDSIDNKLILELGTGSGLFIRQFISYIKSGNTYIVTDHNINNINEIKLYLEKHAPNNKFVFICTDISKLPIKSQQIDYVINYATSITYNLNDNRMLDSVALPKIKKGGKLISCCPYVKSNYKLLSIIPKASRRYYEENGLKKAIHELNLKSIKITEMNSIEEVESKYEDIFRGKRLYSLVYCGQK